MNRTEQLQATETAYKIKDLLDHSWLLYATSNKKQRAIIRLALTNTPQHLAFIESIEESQQSEDRRNVSQMIKDYYTTRYPSGRQEIQGPTKDGGEFDIFEGADEPGWSYTVKDRRGEEIDGWFIEALEEPNRHAIEEQIEYAFECLNI